MSENSNEFSFHEMEEIKRRLAQSSSESECVSSPYKGQPMGMFTGAAASHANIGMQPESDVVTQASPTDLESLQMRRALRIVRNHWIMIILLSLALPLIMFLYDAGFNYPGMKSSIPSYLRARQLYTAEVNLEVRESLPPIGSTIKVSLPIDKRNIRKIINREDFKHTLTDIIVSGSTSGNRDRKKPLPAIIPGIMTDDEMKIYIRGGDRQQLDVVAEKLVPSLNHYIMQIRKNRFQRTLADHEKIIDENKAKLVAARTNFERLDAIVNPKIEGLADSKLRGFALVHQLENEKTKLELNFQQITNELNLFKRKVNYDNIAKRFGIINDRDIMKVMVSGNPLRAEWAVLETELTKLEARYTDNHPQIITLRNNIDAIKNSLRERGEVTGKGIVPGIPKPQEMAALKTVEQLHDRLENAKLNLETLSERIREARQNAAVEEEALKQKHLTADMVSADILNQRNKALNDLEHLMSKDREAAKRVIDLKMLENFINQDKDYEQIGEILPAVQTRPKTIIDISVALVIGLLLGLGVAFLLESMDNFLHTPSDIYYHLKLNCLGIIPYWGEKDQVLIEADRPDSHIAEIYAHLCNNIRYGRVGNPEKRLLVVSATQGEGKSTVAANLAARYALEGNSVALIDADIRRPRGHKILEIFQESGRNIDLGVSDYLGGLADFDDITYGTNVPDLTLIPAGKRVRNAGKLMGSAMLQQLLLEAENRFDIVIVDCPPVLPVVDATILAPHMRGILMVIAAEEVEIAAVRMALYRLQHVGAPIAGAVLNKVRERSTNYTYYGYRYRSGYYYSPYCENNVGGDGEGT